MNDTNKAGITSLLDRYAGERDIQAWIKSDLSRLAGEFEFAQPASEYIAFSEFPIGDRVADFVLFTGRSRMEVVIIEIKGADFVFRNSNGDVAMSVHRAADQIEAHLEHIERSYESFRRHAYELRRQALAGHRMYNALVGPQGLPEVNPEKDINYRGIVIGGRASADTSADSRLRHRLENKTARRVRFDSWHSWLSRM